jgi:hypothetical protein
MRNVNIKKNLRIKLLGQLIKANETVLFFHPTKVLNIFRNTLFLQNRIKVVFCKPNLLQMFFGSSKLLPFVSTSFFGLIFFPSFKDLLLFLQSIGNDASSLKLIILFAFWFSRNRLLSLSYLYASLNQYEHDFVLSFSDKKNLLGTITVLFGNLFSCLINFFVFINNVVLFYLISCLLTDN